MVVALLASGWVNPWLLGGVGLVGVPLLIHLLSRRRFRRIDWAAMNFLFEAEQENRRRVRFEEWLLVALRCLAMGLLALLVARPFVEPGLVAKLLGGGGQTQRVVVLDDSASLSYRDGARSDFDQLREAALRLVGWLAQAGSGDALTVYSLARPSEPIVDGVRIDAATLPDVRTALEKLRPRMVPGQPRAVLAKLAERIEQGERQTRTDVFILSDFQRSQWLGGQPSDVRARRPDHSDLGERSGAAKSAAGEASPFAPLARLEDRPLRVVLLPVGQAARDNLAIEAVTLETPQVVAGFPAICRATVANLSSRVLEGASLTVEVDGAPRPPVPIEPVEPGRRRVVSFEVTIPDAGIARLVVGLEAHDGLAADDRYQMALDVRPAVRVLLVDGAPSVDPLRDEVHTLRMALAPPGVVSSGIEVRQVTGGELADADLSAVDCVMLCNVGVLDSETVARLVRFVSRGGGLAIMLGDQIDATRYNQLMYAVENPLLPAALGAVHMGSGPDARVGLVRVGSHPLTRMFPAGGESLGESVRFRGFFRVQVPAAEGGEADAAHDVRVLALYSDPASSPALLERRVGQGRVILLTTTADMDWNDWPRALDGSYVVTMLEMARYLARRSDVQPAYASGQTLRVAIRPEVYEPKATFRSPRHPDEPAVAARVEEAGGAVDAPLVLVGPRAEQLGTYWVELLSRSEGAIERPLCVNLPPRESDLAAAGRAELDVALGAVPHEILDSSAALAGRDVPTRRELWPAVLLLLVVTLLSEQFLAWWFGRRVHGRRGRGWWRRPMAAMRRVLVRS